MNKYINLIFGILGLLILANTFTGNELTKDFFGYQINVWTYRSIWIFITVISFLQFYNKNKNSTNQK